MTLLVKILILILSAWVSGDAESAVSRNANGRIVRSQVAKKQFVKANACPSTGLHKLPCRGYVIDHVKALAPGDDRDESELAAPVLSLLHAAG